MILHYLLIKFNLKILLLLTENEESQIFGPLVFSNCVPEFVYTFFSFLLNVLFFFSINKITLYLSQKKKESQTAGLGDESRQ